VDYLRVYQGEPRFPGDDGTNDNEEHVSSDDPAVVPLDRLSESWWKERHENWKNNVTTGQK
jgi:hypothetical protein